MIVMRGQFGSFLFLLSFVSKLIDLLFFSRPIRSRIRPPPPLHELQHPRRRRPLSRRVGDLGRMAQGFPVSRTSLSFSLLEPRPSTESSRFFFQHARSRGYHRINQQVETSTRTRAVGAGGDQERSWRSSLSESSDAVYFYLGTINAMIR